MAEQNDAFGRYSQLLPHIAIGRVRILIETGLGGNALAFSIASVVERQQVEPQPTQAGIVKRTIEFREIARIPVTYDEPVAGRIPPGRYCPAPQAESIL